MRNNTTVKHKKSTITGRAVFFLFFIFYFSVSFSQPFTNSPYSRYGLGELQYGGFANNIPMGGIYNALQNDTIAPFFINSANPAALASTRLTVFDLGVTSNTTQLQTDNAKVLSNNTSLSYMALAFPVAKWWGASFGMLPYSSVGYKIYDEQVHDTIGTVKYSYEGEGGINQVYLGNGFRKKNFSAGINISYLFGDLIFNSRDSFPKASNYYNTRLTQTTRVSDFYYRFGAQYRKQLSKSWSLTLGTSGSMKSNISIKKTVFAATYKNDFGVEIVKDTILNENSVKDTITIPMMLGGGFVLKKGDKWLIGFDYSMQNWSEFNSFGQQGLLKNSQRIALGIQYIPNKNAGSKDSYFKRIFYRAGFRYTDTYLEIRNTALKDYAITFGAGFPLRKVKIGETYSQSIINFGFEIGKSGTMANQLIEQKYIKAVFSFTLNDRWFIKMKYD